MTCGLNCGDMLEKEMSVWCLEETVCLSAVRNVRMWRNLINEMLRVEEWSQRIIIGKWMLEGVINF